MRAQLFTTIIATLIYYYHLYYWQSVPALTCQSPFTGELETGFAALIKEAEDAAVASESVCVCVNPKP